MAAASDKARFHLEQQVKELNVYERKQIFSRDEIRAIVAKRSAFEHTLGARGSRPEDWLRYAEYEMNLDRLRKLRCRKKGVKVKDFEGQKTVFYIFERATTKFRGSIELWVRYIEFCRKEKATRKIVTAFTDALRLHPRNCGLWVLAAKYHAETQGDMSQARSHMQRAIRFNKDERKIYLEYFKLEMVYLAKLAARRKILGLDEERKETEQDEEDMIVLPTITAEDIDPEARTGVEEVNAAALERLASAPAYTGAIPIAIFDAATKQVPSRSTDDKDLSEEFFDLVLTFSSMLDTEPIVQHILAYVQQTNASSAASVSCQISLLLHGLSPDDVSFPERVGEVLLRVKEAGTKLSAKGQHKLARRVVFLFLPYLREPEQVDEDLLRVLEISIRTHLPSAVIGMSTTGLKDKEGLAKLGQMLADEGRTVDATNLGTFAADVGLA